MMKQTVMEFEACEAPQVVAKQLQHNKKIWQELCERLRLQPAPFVMTIGRGSSDHACTFAKYLFETQFGLATVSAAPSVLTLYGSELKLKNVLVIGISQSGKSPDICDVMAMAKKSGAVTVAIVNNVDSPLAHTAEYVIPMLAGEERAVAATKSYIASLASLVQFTAYFSQQQQLVDCLNRLEGHLQQALELDWSMLLNEFAGINETLVLARGFGFPVALEAALKFKETCGVQAEAFSGAEVLHGPVAIIKKDHPYLLFTQGDNSLEGMLALAKRVRDLGGKTIVAASPQHIANNYLREVASIILPLPNSLHSICDPITVIQIFYLMIARLSVLRGFNPDAPQNLQKITQTT